MLTNVSVVEDDARTLDSLVKLIAGWPGLACVGAHRTGGEALRVIPRTKPDVVVVDLQLRDVSGTECIFRLSRELPQAAILVFSVHDTSEWIFPALQAGACGYLIKGGPPSELLNGIAAVHRGEYPLCPHIAGEVLKFFRRSVPDAGIAPPSPFFAPGNPGDFLTAAAVAGLTQEEKSILEKVSAHAKYTTIAKELGLSERTINNRMRGILEKLHVASRPDAVKKYEAYKASIPPPTRGKT